MSHLFDDVFYPSQNVEKKRTAPVDRGSLFGEFEPVLDQLDGNEILDFQ